MQTVSNKTAYQSGLGLVELMVGITVGLIVTAGATIMAVNQINEHRRLMVETQIQQDLRAVGDLLIQEIRRAGFRYGAEQGVWSPGDPTKGLPAKAATENSHAIITQPKLAGVQDVLNYQYAIFDLLPDQLKSAEQNTVASNNEFGFKREGDVIKLQVGRGNWQPVTDPAILKITKFPIVVKAQKQSLEDFCDKPCVVDGDCPSQEIRRIDFSIEASATSLNDVKRSIVGSERVRADLVQGRCPS